MVDNEKKIKSKGKRKEAKKRGLETSPRDSKANTRNHNCVIDDSNSLYQRAF